MLNLLKKIILNSFCLIIIILSSRLIELHCGKKKIKMNFHIQSE